MTCQTILFLSSVDHLSTMAEAWAAKVNHPSWTVVSTFFTKARQDVFPVEAMKEVGITLDHLASEPSAFQEELIQKADVIVLIFDFEHDATPSFQPDHEKKVLRWNVPNPVHANNYSEKWVLYQEVCDELALHVQNLHQQIT